MKQEGKQNPHHTENVMQASRHCHTGCWECPGVAQDTSRGYREEQKPWRWAQFQSQYCYTTSSLSKLFKPFYFPKVHLY